MEFSTGIRVPDIPRHLSIPQFMLDHAHTTEYGRPARTTVESPWLVDDDSGRQIGLTELRLRTNALASALKSRFGIREDDVVVVFSRNHVDYPVVIWAVHRLGGIISGANPEYSSSELLYQLEATKANIIIANPEALSTTLPAAKSAGIPLDHIILLNVGPSSTEGFVSVNDLVEQATSNPRPFLEPKIDASTKLAFLSFSSGTTGRPKAVAIPHISVIANVLQMATHNKVSEEYAPREDRRYRPGDVCIAVLPFYHIYGLVVNMHFTLFSGLSLVIVPKFNFVSMLKSIVRHRITHLMIVPPMAVLLCKHPEVKNYDLRHVRMIMIGAAPLSDEVNRQLFQLLPDAHIGQAYGMTETCTATTMWPITEKRGKSGSAGQLMPGVIARVLKPDGSVAGYDEPGELIIWSPSNALCYHNNQTATQETFVDGWVRTGDEARVDRNNEVWIMDRLKEIMKVRGFQVAPAELEGCILDHPAVADACVVGIPDDYSGEIPLAFVVLTEDAQKSLQDNKQTASGIKASIAKHVAEQKVKYKHLAGGVEFVPSIPKNPSGKLLRRVLREAATKLRRPGPAAKL